MSLITHSPHGSSLVLSSKSQQWSKGSKLNSVVCYNYTGQSNKSIINHRHKWRYQPVISKRLRSFKVYSFKGSSPTNEGPRDGASSSKKTASFSCSQQEREDVRADSSSAIGNLVSLSPERSEDTITGSRAVENLFKRWLILLRSQKPGPIEEQIHIKELGQHQSSDATSGRPKQLAGNVLKAVFLQIWALDATLKFPLLIVPPAYLAIRLVHGAEVARELTPLWVFGPILIALYINVIRGLCFLYAFCFRQTKKLIINMPTYYTVMASFISEGKLNAFIYQKVWYPIEAIKNMDYKEFSLQKLKQFIEWANEKRLDYVESVWPYYCRTIRFLKKANLI